MTRRRCAYCGHFFEEDYCIDLREYGLGCYHTTCAMRSPEVAETALDYFIDDNRRYLDIIYQQDAEEEWWAKATEGMEA